MRTIPLVAALALSMGLCAPALAQEQKPVASVSGLVFADYSVPTPSGPQAFSLTRGYLSGKVKINNTWSGNVTLDMAPETFVSSITGGTPKTTTEPHDMVLKMAYFQADGLYPGSSLQFGMVSLPWTDYEYGFSGLRILGSVPIAGGLARTPAYIQSWDKGVKLTGDHGLFGYSMAAFNGEGFRATESDGQKSFQARATLSPLQGLELTAIGSRHNASGITKQDRGALFMGYKTDTFRVAVEGIRTWDQAAASAPVTTGQILSAFGIVGLQIPFLPSPELILRADGYDTDLSSSYNDRLETTAGFGITPAKGVRLILDNQNISYNTANGISNTNVVALHTSLSF